LHTGITWAVENGFEIAVTMDSDLQHSPDDLPNILEVFQKNRLDMFVGSRVHDHRNMPRIRRLGNWFSSWIASRFCHQTIRDSQCGYRVYRLASCGPSLMSLNSKRFEAENEALAMGALARLRIGSAPITVIYPNNGSHRSHYRAFWDTGLIVWFYTKEFCRRAFTQSGRQDIRKLKQHLNRRHPEPESPDPKGPA
jgi:hypothetical protein